MSAQTDSMSSTDCGVACQSSSTIPLDHHGRLGPHRAAPDVGKSRQRRPSGAWSDRWPVETDNLSGSSTRAHRPRHGRPGAQKSPAHVPRGYPSRFGDGKLLELYLVRLCVQMCPSRDASRGSRPTRYRDLMSSCGCRSPALAFPFVNHTCLVHWPSRGARKLGKKAGYILPRRSNERYRHRLGVPFEALQA